MPPVQQRSQAIATIQQACLRYVQFQKNHILPQNLFQKAVDLAAKANIAEFPRAFQGRTPVYFPPDLPIIFKDSGQPKNRQRLEKMTVAKDLCLASNYTHLIIPQARIHGKWLLESRLPIPRNLDQKHQIGLYIENREAFTTAVQEFVGFLCLSRLEDINGGTNDFWAGFCRAPLPRYDNVAIYLDKEKKGRICLVDLEYFTLEKGNPYTACIQAIRFFPFHLETILEAAKTFNPAIETHRASLEKERQKIIDYFEATYCQHQDFLQKEPSFTLSAEDKKDLFQKLTICIQEHIPYLGYVDSRMAMSYLQNMHQAEPSQKALFNIEYLGPPKKGVVFPPNWEEIWKEQGSLLFESLLHLLQKTASKSEKEWENEVLQAQNSREDHPRIEGVLPSDQPFIRTIRFTEESPFYQELKAIVSESLPFIEFSQPFQKEYLVDQCISCILKDLHKLQKVALYAPPTTISANPTNHLLFY